MRVELPYKVRFESHGGSPTYNPRTREIKAWSMRYFATEAEARAFAGPRGKIIYAPGEAWADRSMVSA